VLFQKSAGVVLESQKAGAEEEEEEHTSSPQHIPIMYW
jgi:hypothetical protein